MKNNLYVLISNKLDPIYGAVQGGHAVAEWLLVNANLNRESIKWDWTNDYLIYLSVDVEQWKKDLWRFSPNKYQWTWFDEPDLNNQTTAIAIYEKDFPGFIRRKLKQEKLLTGL
jgi:hypothetical protein